MPAGIAESDGFIALQGLVADELRQPVVPAVAAMAEAVRARHPDGALAVLFYGSCLRRPETLLADSLLDFYLLVEDYSAAYGSGMLALANRLLPPNVFYLELPQAGGTLRSKYAVLSLRDFVAGTARGTLNVSLWARFSQPSRLVWVRNAATAGQVAEACARAILTMLGNILPLADSKDDAAELWQRAFRATYAAELRSEGAGRAAELVALDAERFKRVSEPALAILRRGGEQLSAAQCAATWRRRRRVGKLLNLARLVKAAFTFQGGLDYVLWKVKRHSGVEIQVTDWQRRHPVLAAPSLAWKLYRRGAFR
jgi:hypothetical protein